MNLKFLLPLSVLLFSSFWSHSSYAQSLNSFSVFTMCTDTESNLPEGVLYDSGGPNGSYSVNEDCSFRINSSCNTEIVLNINLLSLENCCDFLRIYDGTDADAPLIYFSANEPEVVIAESGNAFIVFDSDFSVNDQGFEISWQYEVGTNMDPITAGFSYSTLNPIFNFPVYFTDESEPWPYSWNWDFGDGTSSILQNPTHSFQTSGLIDVQLISENCSGTDTIVHTLDVQDPPIPVIDSQTIYAVLECDSDTLIERTLYNQGKGDLMYDFNIVSNLFADSSFTYFANGNVIVDTTEHSFFVEPNLFGDLELEVTISGDFNTSNEYAQVFVEGEYIGELGGDFNINDYVDTFVISKEWLEEFLIGSHLDIQIINSNAVDLDQGGGDYHKVVVRRFGLEYIETPTGGIIAAGDSAIVSIPLNVNGLFAGIDSFGIEIITNNLLSPIYIPVVVEIADDPVLDLSNDCLMFSEITAFTSESLDLMLSNTSCSILYIDSINSNNPAFVSSLNSLVLYPGKQETLSVSFLPEEEGNYNGELTFVGNFPPTAICLEGDALVPPVISILDTAINVVLDGCQDSVLVSLDISNLSGPDLVFDVDFKDQVNPPLDSIRLTINEGIDYITDLIPDLYTIPNGETGTNIYDNNGMYNPWGNRIRFNYSSSLPYSNNEIGYSNSLGEGGAYFTNKYPELFFFAADLEDRSSFEIYGYNNGYTSASLDVFEFEFEYQRRTYSCYVKQVFNGDNPSVNHMIIIEKDANVVHDYQTYLYYEDDGLTYMENVDRLYYLLFSNEKGEAYPTSVFEDVFKTFVELIGRDIDIDLPTEQMVLEAGLSDTIDLWFLSENLNSGIYTDTLVVSSNDPLNPNVEIPMQMEVIGVPELSYSVDCLEFPSIFQFNTTTLEFEITNTGCSDLILEDLMASSESFSVSPSQLTLAPDKSVTVSVSFSPDSVDTYSGHLILSGNVLTDSICLLGNSTVPPVISIPDTVINVVLDGCQDSSLVSLDISNLSGPDLIFEIGLKDKTNLPLDTIRWMLNEEIDNFTDLIPDLYTIPSGTTGTSITDYDGMYDTFGNRIRFDSDWYLSYSNNGVNYSDLLGEGGAYFTSKYPELFFFAADFEGKNSFEISGYNNGYSSASLDVFEFEFNYLKRTYSCFVKQVFNGENPSVNHMIIIEKDPNVVHDYSTNLFYENDGLVDIENVDRVYYLLFSNEKGEAYSSSVFEDVFKSFVKLIERDIDVDLSFDTTVLEAGDSDTIDLWFSSENLNSGIYTDTLIVSSNDPLNPNVVIPLQMEVVGAPELNYSVDCLEFPSIFQFATTTLEFEITNTGCSDLILEDLIATSESFSVSPSQLTLAPDRSETVIVSFSPDSIDTYSNHLILSGNIPTDSICLSGTSSFGPSIYLDSNPIDVSLQSCSDSITVPVTIINTGGSVLEFNLEDPTNEDGNIKLDSVKSRFKSSYYSFVELLPNTYQFIDGEEGYSISDGGGDMYDGGNYISFNSISQNLEYSNDSIIDIPTVMNGSYFTLKKPGVFLFAADINKFSGEVTDFLIRGGLGADGAGEVVSKEILVEHKGNSYKAFIKQVVGTSKPSVNHMIILKEPTLASQTFSFDTNDDDHFINGLNTEKRLYYLLFAGSMGYEYTNEQLTNAFKKFLEITEGDEFYSFETANYQLEPGDTSIVDIFLSTNNNIAGDYNQYIEVESNDPLNPSYFIPVSVTISEDVCASFSHQKIAPCSGEIKFTSTTVNNPTSFTWDFGDGTTSTEEHPNHKYALPGNYDVQLIVSNGVSEDVFNQVVEIESTSGPVASCFVGSEGSSYRNIESFTLNTINNQSQGSINNYGDYSCDISTVLTIGVPYGFQIVSDYLGTLNFAIWVDLNNDGDFNSSELLYSSLGIFSPASGQIIIPESAITGVPLRCRVATGSWNSLSPCNNQNGGEYEDYTIIVESNNLPPNASFEHTVLDDCQGAMQFMDQSTNFPTSWNWDFGDGNNSYSESPYHVYSQAGVYEVTLTASNEYGSNSFTYSVIVNALNPSIEASGDIYVDSDITFNANIVGGISWFWNFGDGNSSSEPNPSHVYEEEGIYTVSVEVANGVGCQSYAEMVLSVFTTAAEEAKENRRALLFPNPTTGIIYLENRANTSLNRIQIFNALGQLIEVKANALNEGAVIQLDLSTQPAGTYFVELHFEDKTKEVQMIIKS